MFDRFTDRARRVMGLARQEAERLQHGYIGTEHILLGLVEEGSGIAASVLKNLDVDSQSARAEVEKLVRRGETAPAPGQVPFTPLAQKVLELGLEEASNLGHTYIGTEHLLLGLIRESEGVGAQVLRTLGAATDRVRTEVLELIGVEGEGGPSGESSAPQTSGQRVPRDPTARKVGVLERKLAEAITRQDFERAAKIRDELALLRSRSAASEASSVAADVLRNAAHAARGAARVLQSVVKELAAAEQALRTLDGAPAGPGPLHALLHALQREPEAFAGVLRALGVTESAFAAALTAERLRLQQEKRRPDAPPA